MLPWLTERLYRLRTGVPVNMLLGVRTEGDSESGVRGVDGAVALWDMLTGGGPLGNVAWEKDTLDTRLTWKKNKTKQLSHENVRVATSKTIFILIEGKSHGRYLQAALRVWAQTTWGEPS